MSTAPHATAQAIRPRRTLIVTDAWHPQINGVVRTYEHLAEQLGAQGHVVKVIGPHDFRHHIGMPSYAEIELAWPRGLSNMIDGFAPDDLHIGTEGPLGWAARRYALRRKFAFTTAYHTQFPAYMARRVHPRFMARAVEAIADRVIRHFHAAAAATMTTTPSINAELRERGYRGTLIALPRGVGDIFQPGPHRPINMPPVALYVGRVAVEKNIGAFLDMPWPDRKVVVGDGPQLEALKAAYPDVTFTGMLTGAPLVEQYQNANVFVFPSRTDTFGIVLVEAMACGLPIAAYPVAGPQDIVTEAYLGVLDEDLSVAAAKALALPLEPEPHILERQRRFAHARQNYGWPAIARRFAEIIAVA